MTAAKAHSSPRLALLTGLAICASWFLLAMATSAPAYYITRALGMFVPGVGGPAYHAINHLLRLGGGLILAFGVLPVALRGFFGSFRGSLQATGLFWPETRPQRAAVVVFGATTALLLGLDLARNGLTGLEAYHRMPLWLAALSSLQPALVEELLFRGAAFSVLRRHFPVWVTLLLPSILFGFAHSSWGLERVLITALVGLLLALLRWRTNNLWGVMVIHFLINFGFPVPAWMGWLAALVVQPALEWAEKRKRP